MLAVEEVVAAVAAGGEEEEAVVAVTGVQVAGVMGGDGDGVASGVVEEAGAVAEVMEKKERATATVGRDAEVAEAEEEAAAAAEKEAVETVAVAVTKATTLKGGEEGT